MSRFYLSLCWEMACAQGPQQMQIENSATTVCFDKSDVYFSVAVGVGGTHNWTAYNGEVQTNIIKEKEGLYNEQEQILNRDKQ